MPERRSRHRREPAEVEAIPAAEIGIDSIPVLIRADSPTETHAVVKTGFDEELEDDADDVVNASNRPLASPRVGEDELVFFDEEPERAQVRGIERSDLEPTLVLNRVGRASRLFWLWFAVTASFVSLALGAQLFSLGLSLRQVIIETLLGVALSFLPLGLGSLAGKRSGQPTMVISRATFGVRGNVVPASLAVLTRVVWCSFLLCLAGGAVGSVSVHAGWAGERAAPTVIGAVIVFVIAVVIAAFGYALLYVTQVVLAIASMLLFALTVAMTWDLVDFRTALTTQDGLWLGVLTGAILVFSYLGVVWASSSADLARYQRRASSSSSSMLWSTFGAAFPAFLLIGYGGLLAASQPGLVEGFAIDPIGTLVTLLPGWSVVPLLLVATLSIVSAAVINLYSGGLALRSAGLCLSCPYSVLVTGGVAAVLTAVILLGQPALAESFLNILVTLAVPVAAWAGLFSAEMMLRKRRFDSGSLLHRGGVYADVRWVNLGALVVISFVGYGLIIAPMSWMSWQGYLFAPLGINPQGELAATNSGVLVALVLGLLTPLIAGIPAIRRQERS